LETARTLLADSGLPTKRWAEALAHATHLQNVTNSTGTQTPWELIKCQQPDLTTFRIFGAPCMVKVHDQKRHKLEFKAQPGRIRGFDLPNTNAYRVLIEVGKIFQSRDVTVDENFESKVDRRMLDFEGDAGISYPHLHRVLGNVLLLLVVRQRHHLRQRKLCLQLQCHHRR
jgi:hypothetical protein